MLLGAEHAESVAALPLKIHPLEQTEQQIEYRTFLSAYFQLQSDATISVYPRVILDSV